MHEGIDIGVGYGTPIHAAAAGTVIYCGWEAGYGNLVVIDHGGNLATAYGHQCSIAVTCGQQVSQGDVIGYVGCTGHCSGPHLHFEVRVNGNPVDPLGYLGRRRSGSRSGGRRPDGVRETDAEPTRRTDDMSPQAVTRGRSRDVAPGTVRATARTSARAGRCSARRSRAAIAEAATVVIRRLTSGAHHVPPRREV